MWCTYITSIAMLVSTNTYATTMATPGTCPSPSNCTSRMASKAWAKVATNNPIGNLARTVAEERLHDTR